MNAKLKIKNAKWRMRSSLFLFTFAFLIFNFAFITSAKSNNISTATLDGRLAVSDDAWETVRERYYDPAFHGVDWEAERAEFRPLAAAAETTAELYSVLRRMLGSLHDAHHEVMECLGEMIWASQRSGLPPDGQAYIDCVRRRAMR